MKVIKFKSKGFTEAYNHEAESVEKQEILVDVSMSYSTANEEIAKAEAYNGEYTIEDDGQPEPDTATTDEILNAMLGVM